MSVHLRHIIKVLLLSLIAIVIAYFFLDKPLVFWAYHHHLRQYVIFDYLTKIAVVFAALPILIYPYVTVRFFYRKFFTAENFLLALVNSIVISVFLKNTFKLICSRYWPMTWKGANLSLIQNHVYGFNWFKFSSLNSSFPSGHATITFAGMTVIALFFRKTGWIVWPIALCVALGLLADYYHFLSDVIAGATLGYLVAYCVVHMNSEQPR